MTSFTTINGKPIELQTQSGPGGDKGGATATPAAATHHADCGDVGETGEHGDLGSNAADAKEREAK